MYVKLINPLTKSVLTFEVIAAEAYYTPKGAMDYAEQQLWAEFTGSLNHDARRYVVWPFGDSAPVEVTEITLPGTRGPRDKPVSILTNYDAWLCNPTGKSIERVHRYREGAPA